MTQPINQLICELDQIFQDTANRLEQHARDAQSIDHALRRLLHQTADESAVMEWDPQRPISPRNAFRALAMQVVASIQASSGKRAPLTPVDYEDLLAWHEPARLGTSATEDFFRSIEFARTQSLLNFWERLQLRIAPEQDPTRALAQAAEDLLAAFAIAQPRNMVVPVLAMPPVRALHLGLHRSDADLAWVMTAMQQQKVVRANHAIATLCLLDGDTAIAEAIHETTGQITNRLKSSFSQYQPNTHFHVANHMQLSFGRDHVAYKLRSPLYERVSDHLSKHSTGIEFVSAMLG